MFASGSLQVAKFSKFSQPGLGSGPGQSGHCLAAWWPVAQGWDLPRSLESGSHSTVHCTGTVQAVLRCTLPRVTPYLHLQFIKSNC